MLVLLDVNSSLTLMVDGAHGGGAFSGKDPTFAVRRPNLSSKAASPRGVWFSCLMPLVSPNLCSHQQAELRQCASAIRESLYQCNFFCEKVAATCPGQQAEPLKAARSKECASHTSPEMTAISYPHGVHITAVLLHVLLLQPHSSFSGALSATAVKLTS